MVTPLAGESFRAGIKIGALLNDDPGARPSILVTVDLDRMVAVVGDNLLFLRRSVLANAGAAIKANATARYFKRISCPRLLTS